MDASSSSVFATRRVTVSPSFQRRVGAGTEPFTVNATLGCPVKFMGVSPMRKSNAVPDRAVQATGGLPCASAGVRHKPRLAAAPPTASPLTKVRRETCLSENAEEENRCELIDPQS